MSNLNLLQQCIYKNEKIGNYLGEQFKDTRVYELLESDLAELKADIINNFDDYIGENEIETSENISNYINGYVSSFYNDHIEENSSAIFFNTPELQHEYKVLTEGGEPGRSSMLNTSEPTEPLLVDGAKIPKPTEVPKVTLPQPAVPVDQNETAKVVEKISNNNTKSPAETLNKISEAENTDIDTLMNEEIGKANKAIETAQQTTAEIDNTLKEIIANTNVGDVTAEPAIEAAKQTVKTAKATAQAATAATENVNAGGVAAKRAVDTVNQFAADANTAAAKAVENARVVGGSAANKAAEVATKAAEEANKVAATVNKAYEEANSGIGATYNALSKYAETTGKSFSEAVASIKEKLQTVKILDHVTIDDLTGSPWRTAGYALGGLIAAISFTGLGKAIRKKMAQRRLEKRYDIIEREIAGTRLEPALMKINKIFATCIASKRPKKLSERVRNLYKASNCYITHLVSVENILIQILLAKFPELKGSSNINKFIKSLDASDKLVILFKGFHEDVKYLTNGTEVGKNINAVYASLLK